MMTKEKSTKIVNFMNHEAGVHILGRGHLSHLSRNFSELSDRARKRPANVLTLSDV